MSRIRKPAIQHDCGMPRVMPLGANRYVPVWWVDEAIKHSAHVRENNGYDCKQSVGDAVTGMSQADSTIEKVMTQ